MVGGASAVIGIDPINHVVLQRSMYCPNLVGLYDLNARPCLDLYDEERPLGEDRPKSFSGRLPRRLDIVQRVDGSSRVGVAMGQQPGFYVESFGVQPYRY